MNKLLKKIRKNLNNRRFRRTMTCLVSVISAFIVFVTTYALILPAITEEKIAACGIEEHQHTDDCYTEELICDLPESQGHKHTDSCYTVKSVLSCDATEHEHDENCYDENGELICTVEEHLHGDSCYQEVKELTCNLEESEGHRHSASCYEKKLTCGKEVHVHSTECYERDKKTGSQSEEGRDSNSAPVNDVLDDTSDNTLDVIQDDTPNGKGPVSHEDDADSGKDADADNYVPELVPLNMAAMLNDHTDVYYYHANDGEEIPADSAEITDWVQVKKDTELISTDLVRLYFAYTIPAGSLNETNPTARYRLPDNIRLTDKQIEAINKNENGLALEYDKSSAEYKKYLGAEAIEGIRKPDEQLRDGAEEYISAVVRVKKTGDGSQELVFTFAPYSIEKNQNTYDGDGNLLSAGEKITGWFTCNLALNQIDWVGEETKTAEIIFAVEDKDEDINEISTSLRLVEKDEKTDAVDDTLKDSLDGLTEEPGQDSIEEPGQESGELTEETGQGSEDGIAEAKGEGNKRNLKKGGQSENSLRDSRGTSDESTDLENFLTKVVVSGASLVDGSYVVQEGQTYSVTMTFKESPQFQFDNHTELIYQMPDGITLPEDTETSITIAIVANGRTYEIPADITADTSGRLTVKFDDENPYFMYLEDATNVGFRVRVDAQFTSDISKTEWSAMAERDIILDTRDTSDAFVTKTGVFDEQTLTFTYTIRVTANGTPENVNVKDIITGNALIFNNDVQITGNSSEPVTNPAVNGFDYTFPTMQDGQEITITYTARIDPSKAFDGTITADQTRNTVTVQKEDGEPHTAEYSHSIELVNLDKSNGVDSGVEVDGQKLYSWTIDYNPMALVSVAGHTIKDTISKTSQTYMTYYGDVTVKVLDSSGIQIRSETLTPGDWSWNYIVPAADTDAYHYVFEYQTVVDQTGVNQTGQTLQLINTVTDGGKTDIGTINVSPAEETKITKAVEASSPTEVSWVSHIHVPESGLSTAVVTDTLPYISAHNIGHEGDYSTTLYDAYINGTLEVTGLLQGESYDVQSSNDKVVITFYQDSQKTQQGLQGNPGGHDITIKLTTEVNQDWLKYGYEHPNTWQASHRNTIDINGNETYADATFSEPGLTKTGFDATGEMEKNHYLYTLVLSHVSETPIVIEDTFDTSLLEVATDLSQYGWYFKIWGGDQYDQSYGGTSVNYSDTPTGIRITANDVPLQPNGEYYPYYRIRYYLRLKDGINLDDLAIENGGKFDLTNTAYWGDYSSSYTFTTEYDFLDKELLKAATSTDRQVQYRITYNPAKAELNGGQDLVMRDTLNEHLSIDYSSISITTDPPGQAVPYDLIGDPDNEGGTVARYTIPDSTKVVITYDAMVVGNGPVEYKNVVEANGIKETVKETADIHIDGEGDGATANLKVVKVDGYDASKKLAGVKFKLYSEVSTETGEHYDLSLDGSGVYEMELTTDQDGVLSINGTEIRIVIGVKYYLEEVAPPDGYQNLSFPYQFTLVDNSDLVEYTDYVYFYSDSFQIKNWPLEGLVVGKRVESSDENDYTKEFSFDVSILTDVGDVNENINKTYGDMTFDKGVASFTLKNGQQLSAKDMPPGTKFRVQEKDVDTDTYTVTTTVGETTEERTFYIGETSVEYTLVTFTNTKKENPSGYSLPNTGGPGTRLFIALGSIMIAGAGLLIWRNRKPV